ncbi:ABC transporter, ATP-binding protein [Levilactobacillus koreensis JCM 16448]|uniref:ABC transporter ATP-binding protein n=1 Tax=Levilactobacillus koreensis TaxID=637971 RepID=A0AAC9ERN8_9LACO|nr:ABC transporter ATP-binding protein [Levilactobacillus koreensis]AKP65759.1 ABC transporter ATP-binding protein [Levilactobacillus koreensis]KRK85862.1 ABC transporter, ATP-binding protein [Levilactobacillus koreensis JCM 16448]
MLLEAQHLTKTFGDHVAVNAVDLQIEKGSFTALLGPNGAGKSTTMNMLIGLLQPTAGQVTYDHDPKLGVVFQGSVLDDILTVRENLQIRAGQYRHVPADRVAILSQQLGLTTFMSQRYGTLSGGQRRRVDIARALINEPDVLFLDEPTTGLDIQTRLAIWTLIQRLQRNRNLTVILTTHYLDEADAADKVIIIDHGRVLAQGTATEIKNRYAADKLTLISPDVAQLATRVTQKPLRRTADQLIFSLPTMQAALDILTANRSLISNFEFRPGTMDDAFLALTGKEMR